MIELFTTSLDNPAGATALYLYKVSDILKFPKWGIDQNTLVGSFTNDRLLVAVQGFKLNYIQDSLSFNENESLDVQGETFTPTINFRVQGDDYTVRQHFRQLGTGRFVAQWQERQTVTHPDVGNVVKMAGTPRQGLELTWRYINAATAGNNHVYELTLKAVSNTPSCYTLMALVD